MKKLFFWSVMFCFVGGTLAGCTPINPPESTDKIRVVATTSIVGDVVSQVGGDQISLTILMPAGTDPHEYSPRPKDAVAIINTAIVFSTGANLEQFLPMLLDSTDSKQKLVEVSAGIDLLPLPGSPATLGTSKLTGDPHTWMDPLNVKHWVGIITDTLSKLDPQSTAYFRTNAEAYVKELDGLDTWIQEQVSLLPLASRQIVSDHAVLGYFASRYGFTQLGTINDSFSSDAAPSAKGIMSLEETIRQSGVKAIFVSESASMNMAEQISKDTDVKTVWIYHATLTGQDGPASSYLMFMRYNARTIVEALK